ncbi:MAG: hypothetical protein U0694_07850 [Anaerolineae bacterium]
MRYIRAFFTAFRMTLRGEKLEAPPTSPHAPLLEWVKQADRLVNAAYRAAESSGITLEQRKNIVLRIDSRRMSAETILATVRHHTSTEYLSLLRNYSTHSITAIYASNLNDRYYVSRLLEAEILQNPVVKQAIERLNAHLEAIPPSV